LTFAWRPRRAPQPTPPTPPEPLLALSALRPAEAPRREGRIGWHANDCGRAFDVDDDDDDDDDEEEEVEAEAKAGRSR